MSQLRDPKKVAAAVGCPLGNVTAALQPLIDALNEQGILDEMVLTGLLATIPVETAHTFKPVQEAFYLSQSAANKYFDKTEYGKVDEDTHQRYYGRGFLQHTWKDAYIAIGNALGIDLVNNPDMLLDAPTAARAAAWWWKHKPGLVAACTAQKWKVVRRIVNGGYNGLDVFLHDVEALLPLAGAK